jgi:hypothetical protein
VPWELGPQDGSNDWWGGITDTVNDPVGAVSDPYDTVAGAADAAALGFDEGVGGLSSYVDDEPGNTAGTGDSPAVSLAPWAVDEYADAAGDAADAATPNWLKWVMDNQEVTLLILVVLAFAYATDGTVGTLESSG